MIGTVLDERYRVDAKLAEGGFGAIYRATHVASGLDVALKVLHADLAAEPSLAARFRREAACLSSLHDRHTVATYETGEAQDGTLYIAMELLVGESLHDRLAARYSLPWRTALAIIRDACSSLAEAHERGIVHRDLKPANLMLTEGDCVKVLDFGIARVAGGSIDDNVQLTRVGQTVGTLEYMAPEQVVGHPCEPRTDIYQLGVLAYEMITGQRPFAEATDPTAMITALLTQNPPPPSARMATGPLPADVDVLVMRCLEREPELRYASVHALVAAIEEALLGPSPHVAAPLDGPTWISSPLMTPIPVARPRNLPTFESYAREESLPPSVAPVFAPGRTEPMPRLATSPMFAAPAVQRFTEERPFVMRAFAWTLGLAAAGFAIGTAVARLLG